MKNYDEIETLRSVAVITDSSDNPKLQESLKEANEYLDKMYEKYKVEDKIREWSDRKGKR